MGPVKEQGAADPQEIHDAPPSGARWEIAAWDEAAPFAGNLRLRDGDVQISVPLDPKVVKDLAAALTYVHHAQIASLTGVKPPTHAAAHDIDIEPEPNAHVTPSTGEQVVRSTNRLRAVAKALRLVILALALIGFVLGGIEISF